MGDSGGRLRTNPRNRSIGADPVRGCPTLSADLKGAKEGANPYGLWHPKVVAKDKPKRDPVKITNDIIAGLEWDGSQHDVLWDTGEPGLGLRLRKRGPVWVARRQRGGVKQTTALGKYTKRERAGALTIPQARREARKWMDAEPEPEPATVACSPTLAAVWERFQETEFPRLSKRTQQDYTDRWRHLDTLADRTLDTLRGGDVIDLHAKLRTTPTTGNRVVAVFSNLWNYARARGETPDGRENPAKAIDKRRRHDEQPRKRVATPDELRAFLRGVDECEGLRDCERVGLLLVAHALMRPIEIVRLRWSWVDLEEKTITIPASEAKGARISGSTEPEVVALTKTIAGRLGDLKAVEKATVSRLGNIMGLEVHEEHVVPSVRGGGMFDLSEPWHAVKAHAKLPADIILYDFKRTSLTMLRDAGVPDAWRHAAARHREQDVQAVHYAAANLGQARKAIDKLEKLLAKVADRKVRAHGPRGS